MPTEFKLPEVGEGIESGTVVGILVAVGDTVEKDQPVLELETDKAVVEVPSSVAGVVQAINVKENEEAKVGQVILTVGDEGADAASEEKAEETGGEASEETAASAGEAGGETEEVAEDLSAETSEEADEARNRAADAEVKAEEELEGEEDEVEEETDEAANAKDARKSAGGPRFLRRQHGQAHSRRALRASPCPREGRGFEPNSRDWSLGTHLSRGRDALRRGRRTRRGSRACLSKTRSSARTSSPCRVPTRL